VSVSLFAGMRDAMRCGGLFQSRRGSGPEEGLEEAPT